MVALNELTRYLDALLQCPLFSDYGPNGLQVEGRREIKRIASAVTASIETIRAAIAIQADLLLVHHGLFWQGDSPIVTGPYREKLQLLLSNQLSLLGYHLPLDAHQEFGNNWKAARDLGWTDLEPFGLYKGMPIGVKGRIRAISRKDLQTELESYYKHHAHTALGGKETVQTIALISGGAHKSIAEAINAGVDCFVTGSMDEPVWHLAHEGKINFFALGHSATERIGPQALGQHIKQTFGLEHQFLDLPNPF